MTIVHYTAQVEENGFTTLPTEAEEAPNLQPGDTIEIQVDAKMMEQERGELRHALDIGLEQFERGEYSVYTAENIHELVNEIKHSALIGL